MSLPTKSLCLWPSERLFATRLTMEKAAQERTIDEAKVVKAAKQSMAIRSSDARPAISRRCNRGLRQQHSPNGTGRRRRKRVYFPGFRCSCLYSSTVLAKASVHSVGQPFLATQKTSTKTDQKVKELIQTTPHLHNWLWTWRVNAFSSKVHSARICWVGLR